MITLQITFSKVIIPVYLTHRILIGKFTLISSISSSRPLETTSSGRGAVPFEVVGGRIWGAGEGEGEGEGGAGCVSAGRRGPRAASEWARTRAPSSAARARCRRCPRHARPSPPSPPSPPSWPSPPARAALALVLHQPLRVPVSAAPWLPQRTTTSSVSEPSPLLRQVSPVSVPETLEDQSSKLLVVWPPIQVMRLRDPWVL